MRGARLDAFILDRRLGGGGMGEVYRALHEPSGRFVALKLLTGKGRAQRQRLRRSVRLEAEALARLSHPGVVAVLDRGVVDTHADRELVPGAPWLAIEFCEGGHLQLEQIDNWKHLRALIVDLLRVLSHIHARGILHGDLKPANILFDEKPNGQHRRPKIADFGLARLFAAGGADYSSIAGTPLYMAPEQIRNDWRQMGPPTDLYGLACVIWRLLTGLSPHGIEATDIHSTLFGHLDWNPCELEPRFDVPDTLESWLTRSLQKRAADRFVCAADALAQLPQMKTPRYRESVPVPSLSEDVIPSTQIVWSPDRTGVAYGGLIDTVWPLPEVDSTEHIVVPPRPPSGIRPCPNRPCPMAENWRLEWSIGSRPLLGPGLGLLSLRSLPPLGRSDLKDRMWDLLRRVAADRKPRWIRLEGQGGVGTSHMVRWLTERALELGAAQVWRVNPHHGAAGLVESLIDLLRCRDLDSEDLTEHLEKHLPSIRSADREALKICLESGDDSDRSFHALIWQVLRGFTQQRPLILAFDDLAQQADVLELVDLIFDRAALRPLPILVVIATSSKELESTPILNRQLQMVERMAEGFVHHLAPLSAVAIRAVLDQLIHLDTSLSERVVASSGGRPLFAVHLVSDWLERGLLEPSPEGLRLKAGVEAKVPANLEELFTVRIELILGDESEAAMLALEVAACERPGFAEGDWIFCCGRLGLELRTEWLDLLVNAALLKVRDDGFRFAHRLLSDCLQNRAERAGRRSAIHGAWAACKRSLDARNNPEHAESMGRHLLAAGAYAEAIHWLQRACQSAQIRNDHHRALDLLSLADEAAHQLAIPPSDPVRLKIGYDRLNHLDLWAGPEAMLEALEPLLLLEEEVGPTAMRKALWNARGVVAERKAHLDEADRWYARAQQETEDPRWLGMINSNRAWSAYFRAKLPQAQVLFQTAWENVRGHQNTDGLQISVLQGLSLAHLFSSDRSTAESWQRQLIEGFGSDSGADRLLRVASVRANFLRLDEEHEQAVNLLLDVIRLCRRRGIAENRMRRVEIQLTWSRLSMKPDLRSEQILRKHIQRRDPLLMQGATTGLVLQAIQLEDSEEARSHLQTLSHLLDTQEYREVEAAPVLDRARILCRSADLKELLRRLSLRLCPTAPAPTP
ncbi:MAG: hypothetical protein CMH58_08690 [Myxococcales bacterium]|nr:hypothetical protein [Myxococcales bacterium]